MKKGASSGAKSLRILLVTLLLLLGSFGGLLRFAYRPPVIAPALSLDAVYKQAAAGAVRSATLLDEDSIVIGQTCVLESALKARALLVGQDDAEVVAGKETTRRCGPPLRPFQASYPRSDVSTQQLIERMVAGGAKVTVDKQTSTAILKLVLTFMFPLLVLANLFAIIFAYRGGESSVAEIAGFGRIGRKRNKEKNQKGTGVTFADVAGAEEAVTELKEVTDYLKDPTKFEAYGAAAPKGVLLFGPPGCGKTLLARAVAGEAGVPFFSVSGAEFIESLVGVGAARVRDLFSQVREAAPAIVFIDEFDAVGRRRSGEGSTGGEREQTVNQLLVELDGFEVTAGIVLMGATNRPDILDPALLRPGRFDRHVVLEAPDLHGRQAILELHAKGKPIAATVDFEQLARRMPGFTGADLANVINEGALLAIRKGEGTLIDEGHLSQAVERVLHGPQRRGKLMSSEERKRLAFHEAGHGLVAAALGKAAGVERISIIATGRGLGSSSISEETDRVLLTADDMQASLAITLAGIAAERLIFGNSSTTGQNDIGKANLLAREMVGIHGMSDRLGLLKVLDTEGGYLSSEARIVEAISGQSLAAFDDEVRAFLEAAEKSATSCLKGHSDILQTMAEALEQNETLEGPSLQSLLAAARPHPAALAANGYVAGSVSTEKKTPSSTGRYKTNPK